MMLLSLRHMFCIYPELEKLCYCDPLLSRPWHLLRHKGSQQRALPTQKSWSTVKLRSGICSGGASCACSCTDAAACHLLPVAVHQCVFSLQQSDNALQGMLRAAARYEYRASHKHKARSG